jgi:hypothetical protein
MMLYAVSELCLLNVTVCRRAVQQCLPITVHKSVVYFTY